MPNRCRAITRNPRAGSSHIPCHLARAIDMPQVKRYFPAARDPGR